MAERLVHTLLRRAEESPDRLALVAGGEELTWKQLAARVRGTARQLAADGVRAGDKVILAASTSPSFVCGYFATHLLRAIALPVDPRIPAGRLGYIADATDPKGIWLARALELPGRKVAGIDELGRAQDANDEPLHDERADTDAEATCDILFTSGTTGKPKGVILSHRATQAAARNINEFIGNGADDVEVVPLPLSHSFGLGRLRCEVLAGGAIVLVDGFTAAGTLFEAMRKWKATGFVFVPAGLAVLLKTTGDALGEFAGQLRWVEIGSAAMPPEHKETLKRLLPDTRLCMHYGLTEASRSAFVEFHEAGERMASIGKPTPGVSIRVVDAAGKPLPAGGQGRLVVKSRAAMSGYWNDPEMTAAAFVDGEWLITGDVGRMDDDGYLYLEAREKDLINVGGREVSPVEIERILEEHEAVAACACVGIPDPQGITGSAVKAYLVAVTPGETPKPIELVKLLRGRIEPYKMPVAFEWIDELPRTDSGKLQRGLLAAR